MRSDHGRDGNAELHTALPSHHFVAILEAGVIGFGNVLRVVFAVGTVAYQNDVSSRRNIKGKFAVGAHDPFRLVIEKDVLTSDELVVNDKPRCSR